MTNHRRRLRDIERAAGRQPGEYANDGRPVVTMCFGDIGSLDTSGCMLNGEPENEAAFYVLGNRRKPLADRIALTQTIVSGATA